MSNFFFVFFFLYFSIVFCRCVSVYGFVSLCSSLSVPSSLSRYLCDTVNASPLTFRLFIIRQCHLLDDMVFRYSCEYKPTTTTTTKTASTSTSTIDSDARSRAHAHHHGVCVCVLDTFLSFSVSPCYIYVYIGIPTRIYTYIYCICWFLYSVSFSVVLCCDVVFVMNSVSVQRVRHR